MMKKLLAFAIIILFIGMNVVSSAENIVENNPACSYILNVADSSERSWPNTIVYAFIGYSPSEDTGFYAFGPGNVTRYRHWEGGSPFTGGTWTPDGRWFCSMQGNGTLYEVDPKTFDVWAIGNGGVNINSLAYDPITDSLYGAGNNSLYSIDMETGEQTIVNTFSGNGGNTIRGIKFDSNGVLYGWDVKFSGSSYLYTIDTATAVCTVVGSMGVTLCWTGDGDFDRTNDDMLYIFGFEINPGYGSYLFEIDKNTGEILSQTSFPGTTEYTVSTISYELNMQPPVTTASFDPPGNNGWYMSNVTVTLNATDNTGVIATYYRVDSGVWIEYDSVSSANITISEEGEHTIEYYSYDYVGNIEDVKSSTIYIDKTPPETSLEYTAWKEDCKWYVKFIFNVTDSASGSGGRAEWFLNDLIQKIDEGPGPTYEWIIEWSSDYGHSSVIFKATTWDKAGNQANESIKGSDIKSHPRSQSSTFQFINIWLVKWLDRFPFFQRLLTLRWWIN